MPGSLNISDDIIVYGATQAEHDESLKSVLERLRQNNLTLNKSKCEFNKSSLVYFGYVFSNCGVSPDTKKVDTICDVETPKSAKELRSFLGLVNYCGRFIPGLADLAKPLQDLTKQDIKWLTRMLNGLNRKRGFGDHMEEQNVPFVPVWKTFFCHY